MNDNPLVSAIRFSNAFLVEELMKNYRNLIVTYSNEYVRNCSVLDIAERTKNEKIINIVKKYLVWSIDVNINSKKLIIVVFQV